MGILTANHIVKEGGKYRLLSHKGKNLGTFDSHEEAAKHEGEVEYFKSHTSNMQVITANIRGSARRATFNGRKMVVVPLTMIVPGVLNGSKGPLYYPPAELSKDPGAWNHMPIVYNHPLVNGAPTSARNPNILEQSGLGYVFNAHYNGKLKAEGWFDVENTRRIAPTILNSLLTNTGIELSTGLFTDNVPSTGVYNSRNGAKQYTHIALNHRPDHLAVFTDKVGACSLRDGCGVLVGNDWAKWNETHKGQGGPAAPGLFAKIKKHLKEQGKDLEKGNKELAKRPILGVFSRLGAKVNKKFSHNAAQPSSGLSISPDKACKIIKDGTVNGHALSKAQRGMFGALCGQRQTQNFNPSHDQAGRFSASGGGTAEADAPKRGIVKRVALGAIKPPRVKFKTTPAEDEAKGEAHLEKSIRLHRQSQKRLGVGRMRLGAASNKKLIQTGVGAAHGAAVGAAAGGVAGYGLGFGAAVKGGFKVNPHTAGKAGAWTGAKAGAAIGGTVEGLYAHLTS